MHWMFGKVEMVFLKMANTVLKSLFRRPYTVKYPFGPRVYHGEITRGHIRIDIKECIYCGNCQRKCPTDALVVNKEEKSWTIDRMRCVTCNYCVETCPKKCLYMEKDYMEPMTARKMEVYKDA